MKKTKQAPAPPTVLVVTLEADGSGSLLSRRGELAYLSQFTYQGLAEIITAIQSGAEALITIEQNPPVVDVPAAQPEAPTPPNENETAPDDGEAEWSTEQAGESVPPAPPTQPDPLAIQPELQPKLI